jgi:uncharacterized protein YbjT (DUF2867 family)
VRVRRGDFAEPSTLTAAFEGASQVLVVSANNLDQGVEQATAAIDAAYLAGAERVLYTSQQAAAPDSLFAPARLNHAPVEAHLAATGRPYTSLRNGYYSSSLQFHLGSALESGELRLPADGPVTWTSRADLAAADAAVLAGDARFDGPTPPLVAGEAVDFAQVAAMLSDLTGRTVRRVVVDDDQWVADQIAAGRPEPVARLILGSFLASRRGEFAVADPTLGALLGHEPQKVRDGLAALLA